MRIVRSDLKPMIGKTFENWTVLEHDIERSVDRKTFYICECKCGTNRSVRADVLRNGRSISCGCLKKEMLRERVTTHGMTKTPLHNVWIALKDRCTNPNNQRFKHYGGKGVKVCEEWKHDFQKFYDFAIENGWKKGLTIDRIDNDGDYTPENCHFITNRKQQLNKSNNNRVTINGETLTIKEWCDKSGINRNTFVWRLRNGWQGNALLKTDFN